jgi:RimJ/RimL family protein N-acetyltransferase
MYGGSRIPGVLDEDALMMGVFERAGFRRAEEVLIYQRRLAGFRVAVDMQVVKLRRQYVVAADTDPGFADWWEACTLGSSLRTRFELSDRQSGAMAARVTLWDIQPLASSWGVRAMGLYDLNVQEEFRRCGLATFLVGESLKHLAQEGVGLVEAQTLSQDEAACRVFTKHGFEVIGRGHIFERAVD